MRKQSKSRKSRSLLRRQSARTPSTSNTIRGLGVMALAGFLIAQPTISMGRPGNILNSIEAPGVGGPTVEKRGIGAGES